MPDSASSPVIDTHLHFWDLKTYDNVDWLKSQPAINRSFLPEDLKPHFDVCRVDKGIVIEAGRSHRLSLWWLELASGCDYLGAVVVGCALEQSNLSECLDEYSQRYNGYLVGVRTAPSGPSEEWLDNPATRSGLQALVQRNLSLDLLVNYTSFQAVARIASQYPDLGIILDHCANPPFREGRLDEWSAALLPLATFPNIHIKYSSLLMYTYPDSSVDRLRPIVQPLIENFGVARMMWGSNWPVELLGGTYQEAFQTMQACVESLTKDERAALFGGNAAKFYRVG